MTHSLVHVAAPVQPAYVALPNGRVVVIRPSEPADAAAVAVLHSRCGPRSLHDRYLSPPPRMTSALLRSLVSPTGGCALVAVTRSGDIVGMTQVAAGDEVGDADIALLVRDDHQHAGLGSLLARHSIRTAVSLGFTDLTATGLSTNARLVRMLGHLGLARYLRASDGFVHLRVPLAQAVAAAGFNAATIDLARAEAGAAPAA
jgi:GNAT superfamily N-acetyltransferase